MVVKVAGSSLEMSASMSKVVAAAGGGGDGVRGVIATGGVGAGAGDGCRWDAGETAGSGG